MEKPSTGPSHVVPKADFEPGLAAQEPDARASAPQARAAFELSKHGMVTDNSGVPSALPTVPKHFPFAVSGTGLMCLTRLLPHLTWTRPPDAPGGAG